MEHLFKHLAVRLWTTLVAGSLAVLAGLPPVAGAVGPGWMIVPGIALFAAAFWLSGVVFAALGRRRVAHLLKEATVWDRAGMAREAAQALTRASAVVDSYLFSPFSRQEPASRLLARMAHFQMAQDASETSADAVVSAYLQHFPRDRVAAVKWLNGILAGRAVTHKTHDIAARIGSVHADDPAVQRMLAQFYLAERRCDFAALQTYRHVLDSGEPLPDALLDDMVDLFLAQPRTDSLALSVYLGALERNDSDPRLLPAIAACCRTIRPSPISTALLEEADRALSGIDPDRRTAMAVAFLPELADRHQGSPPRTVRAAQKPVAAQVRDALNRCGQLLAVAIGRLRQMRQATMTAKARSTIKWAALGLIAVGVTVLVVNTVLHVATNVKTVEKIPEPVAAPVTDPFTLQVAAYLKASDAKRYAAQLKGQGLDAYWTKASGAGKTWYQVRIAHYKTKAEARSVGEDLKKRQLIGDYYVANYKRPDLP